MKASQDILTLLIVALTLSACQSRQTIAVNIRAAEDDTLTRVKFHASVITGESSQEIKAETPYKVEFTDQSFIVIALPETDSVNLYMESRHTSGGVTGYSHAGAIFYLQPHGGPGFMSLGGSTNK